MKVLAFAATNSKNSINKKLVKYATSLIKNDDKFIDLIDLNDYELEIYSVDRERENGIPNQAKRLFSQIGEADLVVISLAEFNGTYTSAYKNIFDWMSRIDQKVFQGKKVIYLSTSPGDFGAASVLMQAKNSIQYFAGDLVDVFSLPNFYDNFDTEKNEIIREEFKDKLIKVMNKK